MAKLTIVRRGGYYSDSKRFYKILIDGEKTGSIWDGKVWEYEWPAGKHTVKFKIDWCSSRTIEVDVLNDNFTTVIECWPASTPLTAFIYIIFRARKYISAELLKNVEVSSENFGEDKNQSELIE